MRDLPARIVAVAARLLHGDRREWGAAMTAELAQLLQGPARWRFALGCTWAVLTAPRHPNAAVPGVTITVTFLAGVAGCIAATAYVLTTWPHAAEDISRGSAVWFAAALLAYLWIALRPPHALVAHRDAARRGAAVGFGLFLVAGTSAVTWLRRWRGCGRYRGSRCSSGQSARSSDAGGEPRRIGASPKPRNALHRTVASLLSI